MRGEDQKRTKKNNRNNTYLSWGKETSITQRSFFMGLHPSRNRKERERERKTGPVSSVPPSRGARLGVISVWSDPVHLAKDSTFPSRLFLCWSLFSFLPFLSFSFFSFYFFFVVFSFSTEAKRDEGGATGALHKLPRRDKATERETPKWLLYSSFYFLIFVFFRFILFVSPFLSSPPSETLPGDPTCLPAHKRNSENVLMIGRKALIGCPY